MTDAAAAAATYFDARIRAAFEARGIAGGS